MRAHTAPIRTRPALAFAAVVTAIAAAAGGAAQAGGATTAKGATTIKSGAGPGWPKVLHPSDFVGRVDNAYFPLKPGSTWRYRGEDDGGHFADHMHVKHKTKTIVGVETTVVHDVVLRHGDPREVTNDWYAQDKKGNVWYFGERTKELDKNGHIKTREGSWKTGRDGARPGVLMPGHPRVGQHARQEYYKGHAEDHFKVLDLNAKVKTPYVSTNHALRTREWTPLERGVVDNKYYVRGVGDTLERTVKGGLERLRLVHFHKG
jgi:hypothetical protein